MDTEVYDAHVFEDIEEKEYEGNLVVESDQHNGETQQKKPLSEN